jgi:hypothetical protein
VYPLIALLPFPIKDTSVTPPGTLLLMRNWSLRAPNANGVNVTAAWQLMPGGIAAKQPATSTPKSCKNLAPIELMFNGAPPVLMSVNTWTALVVP